MDPLEPDEILGNWAPLLVPFDARGRFAHPGSTADALETEIEALIESEVDGIATGMEIEHLADDELERVHATLARRCAAAQVPFQLAAHAATVAACVNRLERGARHAPGAFRIRVPTRVAFDERTAARCLARFAAASGAVGLVWELSAEQQRALEPEAFRRLIEGQPALFGLDLATCDEELLEHLRPFEDELSVFVPGEALASGWRLAARGSVSLLACLDPGRAQGYCEALEGHLAAALDFERRAQRFLEAHVSRVAPPGAARAKLLCAIGGWCDVGLATRPPRPLPTEADVEHLRTLARAALPEFW